MVVWLGSPANILSYGCEVVVYSQSPDTRAVGLAASVINLFPHAISDHYAYRNTRALRARSAMEVLQLWWIQMSGV